MIFGTDGIRGEVNKDIDSLLAYNVGKGLAQSIINRGLNRRVVIGKDTREGSDTYMMSVASALLEYGIDVFVVGIVSTPMISFFVSRYDFGGGVMITASHNDFRYNGIKVFDEQGTKINKSIENEIEHYMLKKCRKTSIKGKLSYDTSLTQKYIDYIYQYLWCNLDGLSIVIDCANGSNSAIAPHIYKSFSANVIKFSCSQNGKMINKKCGANHIEKLVEEVIMHNADFGIAFDGDGDRLRIVLCDGRVLSGDDILLYIALYLKEKNNLKNLTVVGTIMSSLGLEKELSKHNIELIRTDVGDKNVIEVIKTKHLSLGGEPSGHICLYDYNPTCDALLNSIFFFKCLSENVIDLESVVGISEMYPSLLENIKVDTATRKKFDNNSNLKREIDIIKKEYSDARIVVRPSGTESVIRLFVESDSQDKNKNIIEKLRKLLKN